jgi:hypothetical protein
MKGFAIFLWGMTASVATAATFYVSTSGSDTNSGSQSQPWRTIQHSADVAIAGDLVLVQPGLYPERVTLRSSGNTSARITFKGNSATNFGFYINQSYITLDGFDIPGNTNTVNWEGAIEVNRGNNSIWFLNNFIHDFDPLNSDVYGIHFSYASNAASATANCVVSNNVFKNLSYVMLSMNCSNALVVSNTFNFANSHDAIHCFGAEITIRGNLFTNISANPLVPDHTDIIQTFGEEAVEAYNVIFEQNYIINCVAQLGQLERGPDIASWRKIMNWTFRNNIYANVGMQMNCDLPGTKIYNNLFYRCTTNTAHVLLMGYNQKGYATNSEIKNNIFIECGSDSANKQFGWYDQESTNANLSADYNFVCGPNGSAKQLAPPSDDFHWASWGLEAHGINGGTPKLLFPPGQKFRLLQGSPAIGAATNLSSRFTTDLDGNPRPISGSWDMGPLIYTTNSAVPAPGNLRAH